MGSTQGPTGLGLLMCSPTGEVIFGGETMYFSKIVGRTGLLTLTRVVIVLMLI
jgi:hypothetical protein